MKWRKRRSDDVRDSRTVKHANRDLQEFLLRTTWTMFFSQTFRNGRTLEGARSQFCRCHAVVLSRLMPKAMFWVLEPHKEKTTFHVHGLLSLTSLSNWPMCAKHARDYAPRCDFCAPVRQFIFSVMNDSWRKFGTLRIRFLSSTSRGDETALRYCLKYALKSNANENVYWNLWTKSDGPLYTPPVKAGIHFREGENDGQEESRKHS